MSEGPFGGPRPFADTPIKYSVTVSMDANLYYDPPLASEAVNVDRPHFVGSNQPDIVEFVREEIGDVILAVNSLSSPVQTKIVDAEFVAANETVRAGAGEIEIIWQYVITDTIGMTEGWENMTSISSCKDLYTVLIEENNTPIQRAHAISEFDSGPLTVESVFLRTD